MRDSPRVTFLRRRWGDIARRVGMGTLAIYGGGRHTRWILERLRLNEGGLVIGAILDDDPGAVRGGSIAGISVVRPGDADPDAFAGVVVSSDSIEQRLAERARSWASRARGESPTVFRLYESMPPGPYDGSHDELFGARADGETEGHAGDEFTGVRRIAVPSERPVGSPMPVPPPGVRGGYEGPDDWYLSSGRGVARAITDAANRHSGPGAWPARDILEWGCSSGRVLRHMPGLVPGARCWGCDIDPWTVNWAAGHLSPPLRVFRCTTTPALPLESASFDLVYAVSVFTHLSDHFDAWLLELRRVLRPGGLLFASINDEHVWRACAADPDHYITRLCPRLDFSRPLTDDFVTQGSGPHAQSFWHTEAVRRRWRLGLDVLEITPGLIDGVQTGVVLRRSTD